MGEFLVVGGDKADHYPHMGTVKVAMAPVVFVEGGTLLVQAIPAPAWGLGVGEGSKALCPDLEGDTPAWGLDAVMVFPHSSTVEAGTLLVA